MHFWAWWTRFVLQASRTSRGHIADGTGGEGGGVIIYIIIVIFNIYIYICYICLLHFKALGTRSVTCVRDFRLATKPCETLQCHGLQISSIKSHPAGGFEVDAGF